jgi:hypothetical protein
MNNNAAWLRALEYPIDNRFSEYGFATRVARENFWTKEFTQRAILEYRKFMFLAATSELMVSPSPIVDIVWHEHLTFTQSYQEFCTVLGKQIQHVPSTHDSQDYEKFRLAKERTGKLYVNHFGEQPKDIWGYTGMYESLGLPKATINIRSGVIIGILAFVVLLIPAFFLLLPIYSSLNSTYFITGWLALVLLSFAVLEAYTKKYLSNMVRSIDPTSFLFNLHPLEVIYAKSKKLPHVVNGILNQLIVGNKVTRRDDGFHAVVNDSEAENTEQFQLLSVLEKWPGTTYGALMRLMQSKPSIENVGESVDAIQKYMIKSSKFCRLFFINFTVLLTVYLFAVIRLLTGMSRGRPVELIVWLLIGAAVLMALRLYRLPGRILTHAVTGLYKEKIVRTKVADQDVQWQYFLFGTVALSPELEKDVEKFDNDVYSSSSSGSSSSDSSGDSSCGSSCSSCGGCGGD